MKTKQLWKKFPDLVEMVRKDHETKGSANKSHDFLHALMAAQYGEIIVEDEHTGELAWIAGICHNTDRLFPHLAGEVFRQKIYSYLIGAACVFPSEAEKMLVIEAVENHSKLNDPNDNPVTVALKDADRLANIGPNVLIRSGQLHYDLPAFDPRYIEQPDPAATFGNPNNVLQDIMFCLGWEPMLRLPKAIELARPWFSRLRLFIKQFKWQLEETDLLPCPF